MSNNISLFKQGNVALPDYLREADELTKSLAGGTSGKQISIKGGVWRMMVGGEEVAKNEDRAMNFIVVAANPHTNRTYFADKFEEGKNIQPTCWSEDALENDLEGNVYRLQLPAKSIFGKPEGDKMPLQAYAKFLAGHGVPMSGVVTEARFDTSEAVPVLKFRAVRPLTREEWEQSKEVAKSEDAVRAVEFKMVVKAKDGEPAPAKAAKPAKPLFDGAAVAARDDGDDSVEEPVKRQTKKPAATAAAPTKDVSAVLDAWSDDDEA